MALKELHSLLLIFTLAAVAPILCEWVREDRRRPRSAMEMHNVLFVGNKLQLIQQMLQMREVVSGA